MSSPHRDLPLNADPSSGFLPWIISLMVYLATLSLMVALSVSTLIHQWNRGFQDHITIQIPAKSLFAASSPETQEEVDVKVNHILNRTAGIGAIKVLEAPEILDILKPWMPQTTNLEASFLPKLIDVEIQSRRSFHLKNLRNALHMVAPNIVVEDHLDWQQGLLDLARSAQIVSFAIVALILLAATGTVAFTAQTSLIIHRNIIEVLHLVGATDSYIAQQFQMHALRIGIKAGIIGAFLSGLTIFGLQFFVTTLHIPLLEEALSSTSLWSITFVVPCLVILFMMAAAQLTVRLSLRASV